MKKSYLDANHANADFLKSHGAKFDRTKRSWFVLGEVPDELINFVPTLPSPRIDMRGFSPVCPVCGSDMTVKVNRNNGVEFWGCKNYKYTKCLGQLNYDDGLSFIDEKISEVKSKLPSSDKRRIDYFELRALIMKNISFARTIFNNDENLIVYWLESPNVNLSGASPKSLMTTIDGNMLVKAAMEAIYHERNKLNTRTDVDF